MSDGAFILAWSVMWVVGIAWAEWQGRRDGERGGELPITRHEKSALARVTASAGSARLDADARADARHGGNTKSETENVE